MIETIMRLVMILKALLVNQQVIDLEVKQQIEK